MRIDRSCGQRTSVFRAPPGVSVTPKGGVTRHRSGCGLGCHHDTELSYCFGETIVCSGVRRCQVTPEGRGVSLTPLAPGYGLTAGDTPERQAKSTGYGLFGGRIIPQSRLPDAASSLPSNKIARPSPQRSRNALGSRFHDFRSSRGHPSAVSASLGSHLQGGPRRCGARPARDPVGHRQASRPPACAEGSRGFSAPTFKPHVEPATSRRCAFVWRPHRRLKPWRP